MKRTGKKWGVLAGCAALLTMFAMPSYTQDQYQDQGDPGQDPPSRVARVANVRGDVSLLAAGANDWTDAPVNYSLISGDRVYTGDGARVELTSGSTALRLWQDTDVTITNLTDDYEQIGLAQGSLRVRIYALDPNSAVEVDTPNGALVINQPGDYRVDSYADNGGTAVTVNSGSVQITGGDLNQEVDSGQAVQLLGTNPIQLASIEMAAFDDLDRWSIDRDHRVMNSQTARYVNRDVVGYDDLDEAGSWDSTPDYGPVWYPRSVDAGWRPYVYGHWGYVPGFGYTWIEDESWGFAPFHYGRWVQVGPRWGWVPGPIGVRPVYSPAVVGFVGGGGPGMGVGISIGFGGGGVAAWFPLGVGEPYVPWYRCSPRYVNRVNVTNVNITNIHNTTIVNNYNTFISNTRTVNNVNQIRVNNINYAHRNATVAVPANAVLSGRRVNTIAKPLSQQQQALARQPIAVGKAPIPAPTKPILPVRAKAPAPVARPALMTPRGVAKAVPTANRIAVKPVALPKPKPATALPKPAAGAVKPAMGAVKPAMGAGARPVARPAPVAQPGAPARPGTPVARPGTLGAQPGTPAARPGTPAVQPGTPVRPGTPAARPGTPTTQPVTPTPRPGAVQPPANRPEVTPTPRPGTTPGARPTPSAPNTVRPAPTPQTPNTARPAPPATRPNVEPPARPAPPAARPDAEQPGRPVNPQARPNVEQQPRPAPPAARPGPEQVRPAPPAVRPNTPPPQQQVRPAPQQVRPAPQQVRPAPQQVRPTPQEQRPQPRQAAPPPERRSPPPPQPRREDPKHD